MFTYQEADYVLILLEDNGVLKAKKVLASEARDLTDAVKFTVYDAGTYVLSADEINAYLKDNKNVLNFNQDANADVNPFTTKAFVAKELKGGLAADHNFVYVTDKENENSYLKVDTAANGVGIQFLKFGWTNAEKEPNKDVENSTLANQHKFLFSYKPSTDSLFIQVKQVRYKNEKNAEKYWKDVTDIKNYGSKYVGVSDTDVNLDNNAVAEMPGDAVAPSQLFVKLQNFTVADRIATIGARPINTHIGFGLKGCNAASDKTSIANGLYIIKNAKGQVLAAPIHENDNVGHNQVEWVTLDEQDPMHMPAYQWVITKTLNSEASQATSPIKVVNREFLETYNNVQLRLNDKNEIDASYDLLDGVTFVQITDSAIIKDKKLGYKYLAKNELIVNKYKFNYLNPFTQDYWIANGADKDSLIYVKEAANEYTLTEGSTAEYGIDVDATLLKKIPGLAQLERTNYVIAKNKTAKLVKAYGSKYSMGAANYGTVAEVDTFFFKENNHYDGKHYYALVEANIRYYNVNAANAFYEPKYAGLKNTDQVEVNGAKVIVPTLAVNSSSPLFDKDGKYLVKDNSNIEKAYAYKANSTTGIIELAEISFTNGLNSSYYNSNSAQNGKKVSVDDNSLNLTQGSTDDKFENGLNREIRTSAFAVVTDDSPLYRRFNNTVLGESATDACDSLAFVESVRNEYLMDEWNKNLQDKVVNYAGIWNQGKADGKLFFHIDTAWVNRGAGNIKPQYLISTAHVDVPGTPGVPCTYAHNHYDNNGKLVDAAHCGHATPANAGYHYGKYLVNFSDSAQIVIDRKASANPYMLSTSGSVNSAYTRVGFVEAIHMGDSLYVLTNGFEKMAPADLDTATIIANYKKAGLERFIVNLAGDNHKNVTWSFRYVNPDKAGNVAEEGDDNSFLIESNVYAANETYRTVKGDKDRAIAPIDAAAWLKMHNGCLVLTDKAATFSSTKTGGDGALVFNVQRMTEEDQFVTSNDEIAAEGISIVAGNGTVTVQGAAGKSVVITNILGKVIAETVLTSDNATISVPAGIVAVAVDGEEAVKAIVK